MSRGEDTVVSGGVENCAAKVANESGWAEDVYGNERAPANGGSGVERGWRRPGQEFVQVREAQPSEGLRAAEADIVFRSGDVFEDDLLRVLPEGHQFVFHAFNRLCTRKNAAAVRAKGDPLAAVPGQLGRGKGDSVIVVLPSIQGDSPKGRETVTVMWLRGRRPAAASTSD